MPESNVYLQTISSSLQKNSFNDIIEERSTAEIIANQSQNYVDEKLAEYQATIFQLQGTFQTRIINNWEASLIFFLILKQKD